MPRAKHNKPTNKKWRTRRNISNLRKRLAEKIGANTYILKDRTNKDR